MYSSEAPLSAEWSELTDEKTGSIYYWNKVTNVTSWTRPGTEPLSPLSSSKSMKPAVPNRPSVPTKPSLPVKPTSPVKPSRPTPPQRPARPKLSGSVKIPASLGSGSPSGSISTADILAGRVTR